MHNRCNIVYAIHFHITRYIVSKSLQGMYVKMQEVLMQRNLNKRKVEIVDIVCEKFVKVILLKAPLTKQPKTLCRGADFFLGKQRLVPLIRAFSFIKMVQSSHLVAIFSL